MGELVKRKKLSDQVVDRIKSFIVDNGLKPGDRLPTEHAFADRFGVSRISVREATKALEFLGILDAAPRRGLSVGHVDMGRVTQYLGFHFAINDVRVLDHLKNQNLDGACTELKGHIESHKDRIVS